MKISSLLRRTRRASPGAPRFGKVAVAAAAGAATAMWVEFQARKAERDHPPSGRFIDVDGVRLHYVLRGEGPPVVLLHGNAVTLDDFHASGLLHRLAESHCVIAFDRPGFGYSTRPRDRVWTPSAQAHLLQMALTRLGIERPVVLGHSMGTLVALALALDHPAQVQSLVLLSGYYYPEFRLDALLMSPVAWPLIGDVMRYTATALSARATLDTAIEQIFAPEAVPAIFMPAVSREILLRPSQLRANAEDAAAMRQAAKSLSARYGELRMPVTIIAGAADKIVDVNDHAARLHHDLPQSVLSVLPDTGHIVHYRHHDLIVQAIDSPMPARLQEARTPEESVGAAAQ